MSTATEEIIPKEKLLDILTHGSCSIISDPQKGKTNLAKLIVSEMTKNQLPVQFKIFDVAQVWRHGFLSTFKFQEVNEATTQVWDGEDNILFDIEYSDSERIMQFMGNVVLLDYERNRARKKASGGKLNDWIVYVLEEAQNSLGRYALNRVSGRLWLKAISEAANFNLCFIFIGQRAADISTQAIERGQTRFIGRTTGDNNTRKLQGLIGSKAGMSELGQPLHEVAKTLQVGEFIYWTGAEAWRLKTPRFEDVYAGQRPTQVVPPTKKWTRIF